MIKKIKIPIYFGTLVLIQKKHLEDIPKKWKPKGFDLSGYGGITMEHDNKRGCRYFIIAFCKPTYAETVAHEALHCAHRIFQHRQIHSDQANDEQTAYLVGWIVRQCHKHLKIAK